MKVKLKVNLKVSGKQLIFAGTIFEGTAETLPDYVVADLNNTRVFEILDYGTKTPIVPEVPIVPVKKPLVRKKA